MNPARWLMVASILGLLLPMVPGASAVCVDVQGRPCVVGTTAECRYGQGVGVLALNEEEVCIRIGDPALYGDPPWPWFPQWLCPVQEACVSLDPACSNGAGVLGVVFDGGELACVRP